MSFEKLIADMAALQQETMAKALDQTNDKDGDEDDVSIQAAADEGSDDGEDGGEDGGESRGDESMAKSFSFTLEDGTQVDAVDGTELVKSLTDKFEADKGSMLKALGLTVDMLKSQAAQIETLNTRITRLSGEGRGRKSAVSVAEKIVPAAGDMQKAQSQALSSNEFFVKAYAAQKAGRMTAAEISLAETHLNQGTPVPAHIISRVLG